MDIQNGKLIVGTICSEISTIDIQSGKVWQGASAFAPVCEPNLYGLDIFRAGYGKSGPWQYHILVLVLRSGLVTWKGADQEQTVACSLPTTGYPLAGLTHSSSQDICACDLTAICGVCLCISLQGRHLYPGLFQCTHAHAFYPGLVSVARMAVPPLIAQVRVSLGHAIATLWSA